MDMSGAMPRRSWIDVWSEDGSFLGSYPSRIVGGGIFTDLPAFEPGSRGILVTYEESADGSVSRCADEVEDLNDEPVSLHVLIG